MFAFLRFVIGKRILLGLAQVKPVLCWVREKRNGLSKKTAITVQYMMFMCSIDPQALGNILE